jgi:hypothetical protein
VECRRALLMHHFGESSFGPEQCRETCDVCQANKAADRKVEGACARVQRFALQLFYLDLHLMLRVTHVPGVSVQLSALDASSLAP